MRPRSHGRRGPAWPRRRLLQLEALETRRLLTTYMVSTTADSGAGSLRDAISRANVDPTRDTIDFAIPGTGVQTISLRSPLPPILNPVIIDGTSQPGFDPTTFLPVIELNG